MHAPTSPDGSRIGLKLAQVDNRIVVGASRGEPWGLSREVDEAKSDQAGVPVPEADPGPEIPPCNF